MGVTVLDSEHVVEANDTYLRLLGYTRKDILAERLRWSSLVAPEHQPAVERAIQEALIRSYSAPIECVSIRQDGSRVPTLVGLTLLAGSARCVRVPAETQLAIREGGTACSQAKDGQPDPLRFVGFVFDLTARNQLEYEGENTRTNAQAMREIERYKEEFLGTMIHELRTPLTCVQGFMQLLAQQFTVREPEESTLEDLAASVALARRVVTHMTQSIGRMSQLVEDFLDAERTRGGCLGIHFQRCDLGTIVEQTIEEQRLLAPDRVICLEQPTSQAVPIIADALRIQQVVINFLTNALKYSSDNRPVTVRLEVVGDNARVGVHDEGVGIPLPDQAQIWERFHTATDVTVQSGSGVSLGLGLYISRNIIERHHGHVGVHSVQGHGATFWFELPLTESGL